MCDWVRLDIPPSPRNLSSGGPGLGLDDPNIVTVADFTCSTEDTSTSDTGTSDTGTSSDTVTASVSQSWTESPEIAVEIQKGKGIHQEGSSKEGSSDKKKHKHTLNYLWI